MRFETAPGEQAQVDWGSLAYLDQGGRKHRIWVFENFPSKFGEFEEDFVNPETGRTTRWGFIGVSAEPDVWSLYVGKRVPQRYRGKQNPVQYCVPGE